MRPFFSIPSGTFVTFCVCRRAVRYGAVQTFPFIHIFFIAGWLKFVWWCWLGVLFVRHWEYKWGSWVLLLLIIDLRHSRRRRRRAPPPSVHPSIYPSKGSAVDRAGCCLLAWLSTGSPFFALRKHETNKLWTRRKVFRFIRILMRLSIMSPNWFITIRGHTPHERVGRARWIYGIDRGVAWRGGH